MASEAEVDYELEGQLLPAEDYRLATSRDSFCTIAMSCVIWELEAFGEVIYPAAAVGWVVPPEEVSGGLFHRWFGDDQLAVFVVLERGGDNPSLCRARAEGRGGRTAGGAQARGVDCP